MIISASYRSDIPAFHADWFRSVLAQGWVDVRNPYNRRSARIDLRPEAVDGYVFWTRNARSFRPALEDVRAQKKPFVIHYSVLSYPRALDPAVPSAEMAIADMRELADRYGARAVVWRYDPILLTPETDAGWHLQNFEKLARALKGATDEVVISFAQIYAKSERNLRKSSIRWRIPDLKEQAKLSRELSERACAAGMVLAICTQPELAAHTRLRAARCIDVERLSNLSQKSIAAPQKPNRPGCFCAESRDIGWYDSCAHGCRYCYAVSNHEQAKLRLRNKILRQPMSE